ncbi:MAG: type I phosphomannose isomerase catalytic subunit [Planctomycetota bacterium]|jgi:mannose-6-phosphate isomerase
MDAYPLIFEPILKRRIWGGRRLEQLGKTLPPDLPIGESWEIADLEQDQSVVRTGPAKGTTLGRIVQTWGDRLLGGVGLFEGRFPLLIKFLDAAQTLSVQVHPDESMAARLGGNIRVKNEAWYIIDAEPEGAIYHGLVEGIDAEAFAAALEEGRVVETLRRVPVRPGQCYYLPSGTVHALGAGVVVAEVQTPSDITYRVYDWDRVDAATGRARELHVEQALQCIHFGEPPPQQERSHVGSMWTSVSRLVACESFIIERLRMSEGFEQEIPYGGLVVWIVLEGRGQITYSGGSEPLSFTVGDVVVLPAALAGARIEVLADSMLLEVAVPQPSDLADFGRPDPAELQAAPDGFVDVRLPEKEPPDVAGGDATEREAPDRDP